MWGPEEEGWHFGILNFGSKWESSAVILVECHGKRFRQIEIKLALHAPRIRRSAPAIRDLRIATGCEAMERGAAVFKRECGCALRFNALRVAIRDSRIAPGAFL